MPRRFGTIASLILDALDLDIPLIPLEDPFKFAARKRRLKKKRYAETLWQMKHRGYLEIIIKRNKKFLKLTRKGQLEKLALKAVGRSEKVWDGKWRVIIFDIPEASRLMRDRFRWLLKQNGFVKLQGSVFISPYELDKGAIDYLQEMRLMDFIRILRVDKMDNDSDLRKKFSLTNSRPRTSSTR